MIAAIHSSEETIKTFIQNGSEINKRDCNNNTILHICAIYKRLDNLKYFLKFHSIDAKLKNSEGQTVMQICQSLPDTHKDGIKLVRQYIQEQDTSKQLMAEFENEEEK